MGELVVLVYGQCTHIVLYLMSTLWTVLLLFGLFNEHLGGKLHAE